MILICWLQRTARRRSILLEEREYQRARQHLAEGAKYAQRAFSPGLNAGCASGETTTGAGRAPIRRCRVPRDPGGESPRTGGNHEHDSVHELARQSGRRPTAAQVDCPRPSLLQRRVTEASRRIGRGETIGVVVSLQDEGAQLRRLGRWIEADRRFSGSGGACQRR